MFHFGHETIMYKSVLFDESAHDHFLNRMKYIIFLDFSLNKVNSKDGKINSLYTCFHDPIKRSEKMCRLDIA